jgi:hypothetical protein
MLDGELRGCINHAAAALGNPGFYGCGQTVNAG